MNKIPEELISNFDQTGLNWLINCVAVDHGGERSKTCRSS